MSRKNRSAVAPATVAPAVDVVTAPAVDDQFAPDSAVSAVLPVSAPAQDVAQAEPTPETDPDQTTEQTTTTRTWSQFVNSPANPLTAEEQEVQRLTTRVRKLNAELDAIVEQMSEIDATRTDDGTIPEELDALRYDTFTEARDNVSTAYDHAVDALAEARAALDASRQPAPAVPTAPAVEPIITRSTPEPEPEPSEVQREIAQQQPPVDAATAARSAATVAVDLDSDEPPATGDVATRRLWYFGQIARADSTLESIRNRCDIQCGQYLYSAITEGLVGIAPAQVGKTARLIFADFVSHFTARTNRSPRPHDWLAAHALYCAVSEESRGLILSDESDPFPNSTLTVLARWLDLKTKQEPHVLGSIRPGFETALNDLIARVHMDGLTAKQVSEEMDRVELAHATANAARISDATERKQAESAIKQRKTADRNGKVRAALETVAKTVLEHRVRPSELIGRLKDEGALPDDFAGGYDAATITVADAERFARSLVEADRADIIHVFLSILTPYATAANATAKTAPAPREHLHDAPAVPTPPRIPAAPRIPSPSLNSPALAKV